VRKLLSTLFIGTFVTCPKSKPHRSGVSMSNFFFGKRRNYWRGKMFKKFDNLNG
jgi:hypothetical protein